MLEFLKREHLKNFLERTKTYNFDDLFRLAYSIAIRAKFKISDQYILDLSYPNGTISYIDEFGGQRILYSPLIFIENEKTRNDFIIQNTAHEIAHLTLGKMGVREFCHYTLFKGQFVEELSNQEFRHKVNNLIDNVNVDSKLCTNEPSLYGGFYKSHGIDIKEDIEIFKISKHLRKKNKNFSLNFDVFNRIIEIVHPSVVSRYLKLNNIINGKERSIATFFDSAYHQHLKGAIGDPLINGKLDSVYNELLTLAETSRCKKSRIYRPLRELWCNIEELSVAE